MKRLPTLAAALLLSLGAAVVALTGLALTGPEQSFTIPQGEYRDSYLRIWNEGDQNALIHVSAQGPASSFATLSEQDSILGAGQSRIVNIRYRVPSETSTGLYEGTFEAWTGDVIATSVHRAISVWVTGGTGGGSPGTSNLVLDKGLNLISWPGVDSTLQDVLGSGDGISKVWRRTNSGDYVFASYYPGQGWWSSDPTFTHLRRGEAYFIECSAPCEMTVPLATGSVVLELKRGTNLAGWPGDTMPVDVGLRQSSSYHPITKIWRRNSGGSYSAIQFFPQEATWWSSDSSFTTLENGRAYFIECSEDASFQVPG